ncbi:ScbA/BarX family gamma-butyrolactone biosynthesis protein [Streptomyces sp. NPDC015346]|uniref:ScbA/BarX family gamma-butyrolactone biosynthesis protein n=1 Tax=Streptomyces sp. NPDC015346 TaxID=3364954 RepID=UPI0036F9E551
MQPVPLELTHRARPGDSFPSGWARLGPDRFLVRADWPREHPFFSTVHGGLYDPMLVVESMRQSTLVIVHAAYGVPTGHQFLLTDLQYDCDMAELVADPGGPVDIEVTCTAIQYRGELLASLRADWVVRRNGRICATGVGHARLTSAAVYRRLRGELATPVEFIPHAPPVPAAVVGRTRTEDVLLSPAEEAGRWLLRPDTRHPVLFQRPKDHIPGMLLLEAARQAAAATTTGDRCLIPAVGRIFFYQYAEFASPCWVDARRAWSRDAGDEAVQVSCHQDGSPVFFAVLRGPVVPRPRGAAG